MNKPQRSNKGVASASSDGDVVMLGHEPAVSESAFSVCILRLGKPIAHTELEPLLRKLQPITKQDPASFAAANSDENDIRYVVAGWTPPQPDELLSQRETFTLLAKDMGIEQACFLQTTTQVTGDAESGDQAKGKAKEKAKAKKQTKKTTKKATGHLKAAWTNGLPPRQVKVPFPVNGYPDIVEQFDPDDFGITVKLTGQAEGSESAVLQAFLYLWLFPYGDRLRQSGVTFDRLHHAAHFWVDRLRAPLEARETVQHLLWVMARLNELIPIAHAKFSSADMREKYGHLVGDTHEPVVLGGNPLAVTFGRSGFSEVRKHLSRLLEPPGIWSKEELAMMLQELARLAQDNTPADTLALAHEAYRLAPDDEDNQLLLGNALINAERVEELLAKLHTFSTMCQLSLLQRIGETNPEKLGTAVEILLKSELPDRVYSQDSRPTCSGAAVVSFGNVANDVICKVAFLIAVHAPAQFPRYFKKIPFARLTGYTRLECLKALNNACIHAFLAKNTQAAVELADLAQPYAPENPYIYHSAIGGYALAGQPHKALEQVKLAIAFNYEHLSKLNVDRAVGEIFDWPEFKDLFARWDMFKEPMQQATKLLAHGDAEKAIPLLEQLADTSSPLRRTAVANLALALNNAGKHEKAWQVALAALNEFPTDRSLWHTSLEAAVKTDNLPALVPLVMTHYRSVSDHPDYLKDFTFILNETQSFAQSVQAIDDWLARHGDLPHTDVLIDVVNALVRVGGRSADAVRWAESLVETDNGNASTHGALARALLAAGDVDGALKSAVAVLERDSEEFKRLAFSPDLAALVDDPRFQELLRKCLDISPMSLLDPATTQRLAQMAMAGQLDELLAFIVKNGFDDELAYKWLCVAVDFGCEDAAEELDDLDDVNDDEIGVAHWELALAFLTATDGLPRDAHRAREHLKAAHERGFPTSFTDGAAMIAEARDGLGREEKAVFDKIYGAKASAASPRAKPTINPHIIESLERSYEKNKVEQEIFLGEIYLSKRAIIACDPLAPSYVLSLDHQIKPGRYPVYMLRTEIDGQWTSLSTAVIELQPRTAVARWRLAKSQQGNMYGVDAGIACFASLEAWQLFQKRNAEIRKSCNSDIWNHGEDLERLGENDWQNYYPYAKQNWKHNVVLFSTGGDGVFYSFFGLDQEGKPVCLLTDFTFLPFWKSVFEESQ